MYHCKLCPELRGTKHGYKENYWENWRKSNIRQHYYINVKPNVLICDYVGEMSLFLGKHMLK